MNITTKIAMGLMVIGVLTMTILSTNHIVYLAGWLIVVGASIWLRSQRDMCDRELYEKERVVQDAVDAIAKDSVMILSIDEQVRAPGAIIITDNIASNPSTARVIWVYSEELQKIYSITLGAYEVDTAEWDPDDVYIRTIDTLSGQQFTIQFPDGFIRKQVTFDESCGAKVPPNAYPTNTIESIMSQLHKYEKPLPPAEFTAMQILDCSRDLKETIRKLDAAWPDMTKEAFETGYCDGLQDGVAEGMEAEKDIAEAEDTDDKKTS